MDNGYRIRDLKCGHCGNHLPVMGEYLTFQCDRCYRYWIISGDSLKPLSPARVVLPHDYDGEPVFLPFWIIEIDRDKMRRNIESACASLREISCAIVETGAEASPSLVDGIIDELTGRGKEARSKVIFGSVSEGIRTPESGELGFMLRKIDQMESFNIFVPAFYAANTYAYIKVGRLLTKQQPPFTVSTALGPGRPLMCSLRPSEAKILMDYIFIATLPDSIRESGDLPGMIRLEASSLPRLVEFPFELDGPSYRSLTGNFHIARQLIEMDGSDKELRV
ncbi:MAG: hypothetical protein JW814_01160 [Candidatus Krumholzibacteriota bacterium]|nr:hypothetical protein [Candidatus Krumholzibacteriota bacterium]